MLQRRKDRARAVGAGRLTGGLLVAAVIAASCSSAAGEGAEESDPATTTTEAGSSAISDEAVTETSADDESAGQAGPATATEGYELLLDLLNGAELTEASYTQWFAPSFVAVVGYPEMAGLLEQLRAGAPYELVDQIAVTDEVGRFELEGQALPPATSTGVAMSLRVDPATDQITELLFEPIIDFVEPTSRAEAIERLEAMGTVRLVGGVASNEACSPTIDIDATESMPLASVFKLYVLGAVADGVAQGDFDWDTPVEIRDELDSLPSGSTQDVEPGTELSVVELAEAMIAVSDNTATDHLIDLVGREQVESFQLEMGRGGDGPLLTTRELFVLFFGDPQLGEDYLAADEAGRRVLLDSDVAAASLPALDDIDPSVVLPLEEIGWFASPLEICDALNHLAVDAETARILSINPGIADEGIWQRILYKGGSAPGMVAVAWRVEAARDEAFVLAGSVVSDDGPIDENEALLLLAYLRDTSLFAN